MVTCALCNRRRKLPHVASLVAVSVGALEIANVIQGALEVFWFTFIYLYQMTDYVLQSNMTC